MTLLANLDGVPLWWVLSILGLAAGFYCLPSIVALSRRHPRAGDIVVLNILAGWTVVGWLIAFVWSSWSSIEPNERRQHRDAWSRGRVF